MEDSLLPGSSAVHLVQAPTQGWSPARSRRPPLGNPDKKPLRAQCWQGRDRAVRTPRVAVGVTG
jgi:hypothetical protein